MFCLFVRVSACECAGVCVSVRLFKSLYKVVAEVIKCDGKSRLARSCGGAAVANGKLSGKWKKFVWW